MGVGALPKRTAQEVITGVVVALREELGTITCFPEFAGGRKIAKGAWLSVSETIAIALAGAGPDNARSAAEALVAGGATRLISWGCAAALDETLSAGDLVLADALIDADNQSIVLGSGSGWRRYAAKRLSPHVSVHGGMLAESGRLVSASQEKKQLRAKTNAIALDMESVAVAKVAKQHKLPFLVIRAIADPADMSLPESIHCALTEQGDVVLSKLLAHLALHPGQLPGLIKLGCYFHAAKNTLKQVAKQLDTVLDFNGHYYYSP